MLFWERRGSICLFVRFDSIVHIAYVQVLILVCQVMLREGIDGAVLLATPVETLIENFKPFLNTVGQQLKFSSAVTRLKQQKKENEDEISW
jgi:hypothetical protein